LSDCVRYALPEAVNFDNLAALRRQAELKIDELSAVRTLEIGFGNLSHSGSPAVALMIALFRYAHVAEKTVSFVDVPADILNIIEVSDLSDVLPLSGQISNRSNSDTQ
jgi:ABC-type transporter Mla MlaB component